MSDVLELYGNSTRSGKKIDWSTVTKDQSCPYLGRKCIKVRKSEPEQTIGTCTVLYGRRPIPIIICPNRLLERHQVFIDCLHLLTAHEPGNQLHVVPEVSVPGGSVDYFLVSAKGSKVRDFVGIELQTLGTTGTVWPERQRFLKEQGVGYGQSGSIGDKSYGMNWKMTAKTVLMQLHHKVQTFESVSKHLVLVVQDAFLGYMQSEFRFDHLNNALIGDSMHIHTYGLAQAQSGDFHLELRSRFSTDSNGIALSLGLKASPRINLDEVVTVLESKISDATLFSPVSAPQLWGCPTPACTDAAIEAVCGVGWVCQRVLV
jgi:hypothetical protein